MNVVNKTLSGLFVLIVCVALLTTNISCQVYPAPSEEAITITYDFPEPCVGETSEIPPLEGILPVTAGYVSVTMEGLPQWSEPGLPVLPFKTSRILLPYGFDVERITVTGSNKVALPGSYMVELGQEAVPLSYEGPLKAAPPNPDVYDSSAPFPGKLYSDGTVQNKAGYRILLVNLHPVQYIPEQGQLSYYESLTVEVTLRAAAAEGEWQSVNHLARDEDMVGEIVDNPETIRSYCTVLSSFKVSPLLAPGDYEYVIITSSALNATSGPNNFQALRDEKISRNITATIVTTEWIYATYNGTRPDGGADNQTRIRNFIIDAYNNWGTKYVLLGGDGDAANVGGESGDNVIPHRGFAVSGSYSDSDIPADMYYACLDGSFDYDADGVYGEPTDGLSGGEVDLFAEVYVGRAPVDSATEVQNFVRKTLAYQNMSMTDDNLKQVCMAGEQLATSPLTWGGDYKDEIKEGSSAHGYTTVGFENSAYAPGLNVSTLYDRDYSGNNWPKSEIVGIINNNVHVINHQGHANVGTVMKMGNSDVDGLTNSQLYFIGYSQGCYSGSFDNRTTTPGSYTNYDCISEHLTTESHGAVAFIANSRYGWHTVGSTYGYSQHFDREFWDAVLDEYKPNIGIANQDSKEDNAGLVSNWPHRWCYYEINLFGDPELTLKLQGAIYESHDIDDSAGGDGDGYPEPGESISMPVTLRNISTDTTLINISSTITATTPATIVSEDFDGSWPGNWTVSDSNSGSGDDYWGQSNYRAYSGNFSAYCAEVSDVSGQYYDNDMEALMVKDVDLSAYASATLSYKYWIDSASYYDYLYVGYYDGSWNWMNYHTGSSSGWVSDSMTVPKTATKIGFRFSSDPYTYPYPTEGAYIDDVILTVPSYVTDSYISISDDSEGYGNIPLGGTATSLGAYDFTIDAGCPAGHVVRFNLNITASNGGPLTDSFDEILPIKYDLTISSGAGGTVTTPGVGTHTRDKGTAVNLVATPSDGYQFDEWTGDVGEIANVNIASTTITMYDDYSITANFEEAPPSPVYPTVTTQAASNVNTSSAILNMDYTVGDFSPVNVRFAYKKSADSAWSYTDWVSKSGSSTYAESRTGLDPNTNYDFKAQLKYNSTVIEGTSLQFTTETPSAPGGCFIATAAYGTPMAAEIQILRDFRDEYILTNPVGKALVEFYYKVSPPIAEFITEHPSLKPMVRAGLVPAVAMSAVAVNTTPAEKAVMIGLVVLVSLALVVWATRRRGRGTQYT